MSESDASAIPLPAPVVGPDIEAHQVEAEVLRVLADAVAVSESGVATQASIMGFAESRLLGATDPAFPIDPLNWSHKLDIGERDRLLALLLKGPLDGSNPSPNGEDENKTKSIQNMKLQEIRARARNTPDTKNRHAWLYLAASAGCRHSMVALAKEIDAFLAKGAGPIAAARLEDAAAAWRSIASAHIMNADMNDWQTADQEIAELSGDVRDACRPGYHRRWAPLIPYVQASKKPVEVEGPSMVVMANPPPRTGDRSEATVLARYEAMGRPLPLGGRTSADEIWQTLSRRFPWFKEANAAIANSAAVQARGGRMWFNLGRPLLLVGRPGSGKTRWVRAVAEACSLEHASISLGGSFSSMSLHGCDRGWETAYPSFPVRAIADRKSANPLLLVDEVDKGVSSNRNGDPIAALLGMLEPETAKRYPDPYILTEVDISAVSWILTANSLDGLSPPLLDRCRIVHVGQPGVEHVSGLMKSILEDLRAEMGIGSEDMPDLSADHPRFERVFEEGRSVRRLQAEVDQALRDAIWKPPGPSLVEDDDREEVSEAGRVPRSSVVTALYP